MLCTCVCTHIKYLMAVGLLTVVCQWFENPLVSIFVCIGCSLKSVTIMLTLTEGEVKIWSLMIDFSYSTVTNNKPRIIKIQLNVCVFIRLKGLHYGNIALECANQLEAYLLLKWWEFINGLVSNNVNCDGNILCFR